MDKDSKRLVFNPKSVEYKAKFEETKTLDYVAPLSLALKNVLCYR